MLVRPGSLLVRNRRRQIITDKEEAVYVMAMQDWLLTNGDTIYVERTAVELAEERAYGETNLYVELNTRVVVDDFISAVIERLQEPDAIPIFTAIVELDGKGWDPSQVAWVEPRSNPAECNLYLKSSRRFKLDVTPLAAAEAFGYVA